MNGIGRDVGSDSDADCSCGDLGAIAMMGAHAIDRVESNDGERSSRILMKRILTILTPCLIFAAPLFSAGCIASIGNRNPGTTVGQQLIDLQNAKQAGAITEEEYQTEKAKILGSK
jgi:hypothetical protein